MLADLIGGPQELRVFAPRWEPLFWDVAAQHTQALLASAGEWLAALAVVRAEGEQDPVAFSQVFTAVLERLKGLSETDPVRWHGLMWFVVSWALRRRPSAETEALLAAAQSSQADARRQQEVREMSETILQTRDQEMLARGQELGEARGQLRAYRENLRELLEERFGPLPEGVAQQIQEIDDLERLRQLFRQGLEAASLAEVGL